MKTKKETTKNKKQKTKNKKKEPVFINITNDTDIEAIQIMSAQKPKEDDSKQDQK